MEFLSRTQNNRVMISVDIKDVEATFYQIDLLKILLLELLLF
jgi:hypothetical protein